MSTERQIEWAGTMRGHHLDDEIVLAHRHGPPSRVAPRHVGREQREEFETRTLVDGATCSSGSGKRQLEEAPGPPLSLDTPEELARHRADRMCRDRGSRCEVTDER